MVLPDLVTACQFDGIVRPWLESITRNVVENRAFATTRDYLLPRLLAGEVEPNEIAVQWVSPSDRSERGSLVAAKYRGAYAYRFDHEGFRIKKKVLDKTKKFTKSDATLVALNYTLCPELIDIGRQVILETFTGLDSEGDPTPYAPAENHQVLS